MHQLAARPVAELEAYEAYTTEHGLPLWRIEMQLAQIAMLLDAQRRPGQDLLLRDYLVRPVRPASAPPAAATSEPPTQAQADAAADALGFRPMNRRRPPEPATRTIPQAAATSADQQPAPTP